MVSTITIATQKNVDAEPLKQSFCQVMAKIASEIPQNPSLQIIDKIHPTIPHITEAATNLNPWIADEDLIALFTSLAWFYTEKSDYVQAMYWKQNCYEAVKERLGNDHPDLASSLGNIAALHALMGNYSKAEKLYLQALEIDIGVYGEIDSTVSTDFNNLAQLYESMGYYDKAESLYKRSVSIRKEIYGENHLQIATVLSNLAGLYESKGA